MLSYCLPVCDYVFGCQNGFVFIRIDHIIFPQTIKMASNSRARYSYRERAEWLANKQKHDELKAETKKMENTEANFPTLSTAHPVVRHLVIPPGGFADLAKKWATSDEDTRKKDAARQSRFEESEYDTAIFPIRRYAPNREPGYVCDYEEETPSAPAPDSDLNREEDRGWTVVQNHKTRKPKRELTIDEMDERERRLGGSGGDADYEFNGELYESNRHDHDRV